MKAHAGLAVTPNVRLVELLGSGGMGSVWVADHTTLGTRVAVKLIAEHAGHARQTLVERFRREATLAATIRGPHAVQVHDHGFLDDATPFLVMELLEGHSLRAELEQGTWSLAQVSALVAQVADVLTDAHARHIVHRDIKPENLFLVSGRDDPFIKVLDFGIAKRSEAAQPDTVTRTGAMLGTPRYLSPELIECAKDATPQADLWALAVVAYEALVGAAPFAGETLGALCIAISRAKFDPPSKHVPALPAAVDAWFARALAPTPEQRFTSAAELSDALAAAAATTTDQTNEVVSSGADDFAGERAAQPGRARVGLGAAFAGLMTLGYFGGVFSGDETSPTERVAEAPEPRRTAASPAAPEPRGTATIPAPSPSPTPALPSSAPDAPTPSVAPPSTPAARRTAPPKPSATPSAPAVDSDACMAYDAKTRRWIYVCGSD